MSDRISLESTHLKRQPSFGIAQKRAKKVVLFSQAYQWATNSHLSF